MKRWLTVLLSFALTLGFFPGAALADEVSLIFKSPVSARLTDGGQGISLTKGSLVAMEQADVIMQGGLLVAINGAGIQKVEGSFGSLRKLPTDGYEEEAKVEVNGVYAIRSAAGQYAKLCACGTYTISLSTYLIDAYNIAFAVANAPAASSSQPQPTPDPAPGPSPAPAPAPGPGTKEHPAVVGVLKSNNSLGRVTLTWDAFATTGDGYLIYRSTTPGVYGMPLQDFPVLETTYVDTKVEQGKTYYYRIVAYEGGKESLSTNELTVKVTAPVKKQRVVKLQVGTPTADVDGKKQELTVPPQLIGGRTMVPLRFVSESFGVVPKWDGAESKITLTWGQHELILWVDKPIALYDKKSEELDVPPTIIDGRTLVPLRFITNKLGANLIWDAATQSITLTADVDSATTDPEVPASADKPASANWAVGIYRLRIPGVAYSVPGGGNYDTLIVSPGTVTESLLRIDADGTYVWRSKWDGRVIEGTWVVESDHLLLKHGEEGKDWLVSPGDGKLQDIYVYEASYMQYYGDRLK